MSQSTRKSLRSIVIASILIVATSITATASWTDYFNPFAYFTSTSETTSAGPIETAPILTAGTCGEFGGLAIEVEGTGVNASYATLAAAFAAINGGTHTGAITIDVCANTTEVGPAVLNSSGAGAASYSSVVIRPAVDGVTISGPTTTGRGLIELNGADNVTIDGDNPNSGGPNDRNLTITNTAARATTYTSVVRVALSTLVTTGNTNTVKNTILNGSATGFNLSGESTGTTTAVNTTFGILVGGGASTVAATTAPSAIASVSTVVGGSITATNFTASNNQIDAVARGVVVNGSAVTVAGGLTISGNVIGNASAASTTTVYSRGLSVQGFNSATISGNTFQNIQGFLAGSIFAINIGESSARAANGLLANNKILKVFNRNTGTFGAQGMALIADENFTIRNNFITDISHDMSGGAAFGSTNGINGIRLSSGFGHKVYHNSVNLFGALPGTANSNHSSQCLFVASAVLSGMDIRNNIFSNTISGGTTSIAHVSIMIPSGLTSSMNLTLNNNDYFAGSAANQGVGHLGSTFGTIYSLANFDPTNTTPATNFRAYTSTLNVSGLNDSLTKKVDPLFIGTPDLHLSTLSTMESAGADLLGAVPTDIDGEARGSAPDIGADEITLAGAGTVEFSSQSGYSALEGELKTIMVNRTGGIAGEITVNYATGGGTAFPGTCGTDDYQPASGTLTFPDLSNAAQTFTIQTCNDGPVDDGETVNITLSGGTATVSGNATVALTIADNQPGTIQFSSATYSGNEGATAIITATRAGGSGSAVTVDYTIANDTATHGGACGPAVDYTGPLTGQLSWAANDATDKTFTIPLCGDSEYSEGPETVDLLLSNISGATLGLFSAELTINDVGLTICNTDGPINIPSGQPTTTQGNAAPFGSVVNVSGFTNVVTSTVKVRLNGLTHTFLQDLDVMLVSPTGQKFPLMSDAGGGTAGVSGINLVFSDAAATLFAQNVIPVSGTYRPANYGAGDPYVGAPAGPVSEPATAGTATLNGTFGGFDPNGDWKLFIVDDASGDFGTLTSWCLELTTAPGYTVGGAISGLTGPGLVLRNNGVDNLPIAADGSFTFASPVGDGRAYAVTVGTQPTGQTCSVTNGSGTIASANVSTVAVSCTDSYTVGGTVSGLTGSGLVLQNNLGNNLPIAADGSFTFTTPLLNGAAYSVTVLTQPTGQGCAVTDGSGTISASNVTNIAVTCSTNSYTVGGNVSGLTGTGLVLRNNGADDLPIAASGPFTLATPVLHGGAFAVTVATQPTGQICSVSSGSGTINGANKTNVAVACANIGTIQFSSQGGYTGLEGSLVTITVNRVGGSAGAIDVGYATADNTAIGGASCGVGVDYITAGSPPLLSWANLNSAPKTFTVQLCNDAIVDTNSLNLTLSGGTATISGNATVALNITDNPPGTVQFSAATYSGDEGTTATITATRTGGSGSAVTVDYTIANDTATNGGVCGAGVDYTGPLTGQLSWAINDAANKTITIPLCTDTELIEGPETVDLTLSNISGATLGLSAAELTINNIGCITGTNFDNITTLTAAGWTRQNLSSPIGTQPGWFQGTAATFPAHSGATNSYIAANFNNATGANTISNWLVTPVQAMENGSQMSFWTRTRTGSNFPDRLQVRMSTAGASTNVGGTPTSVGDFTNLLLDINPTYQTGGVYPEVWTKFTVTVSGLGAPTTGRFAFRYFVENGGPSGANADYIGIDTVSVDCAPIPLYTVGGSVTGLTGSGLVLQNNGVNDLAVAVNGPVTFTDIVADGSAYGVTVLTQPTGQTCSVTNGSGTIASAIVTNVAVSCTSNLYTITASAGTGGSISPNGVQSYNLGDDPTFTITPNLGYTIANVLVDGISQGPIGSYTFTDVAANHTISASFTINTYTITASAGVGGSISPTGVQIYNFGADPTFTITANLGYTIADVLVDGVSQGAIGSYTLTDVAANHTISASFNPNTYTITAAAGTGGSISPTGVQIYYYGDDPTFTITANLGYTIADVLVDGVSQGAIGSYTFTDVNTNHTISASFSINTYTITATSGANGSVTPAGATVYNFGDDPVYTFTPNGGYSIADVLVDGVTVGAVPSYTFTDVAANHTISASFAPPPTLVVNSLADTDDGSCTTSAGGCTLREAINAANSYPDASTINFDPIVFAAPGPYTIQLAGALPSLTSTMTINGAGAGVLSIRRNTLDPNDPYHVIDVNGSIGVTVSISGVTITNGFHADGGGVRNVSSATVNISDCVISGNSAVFDGAGINNTGTLNLTNSTVSGNTSNGSTGIRNSGILTVIGSTINDNHATNGPGGGIQTIGGTLTIINSTISGNDNVNGAGGGGILVTGAGTANLTNVTVTANSSTGGGSTGGGIRNVDGTVNMRNSIVANNTSSVGADISGSVNSLGHNLIEDTNGSTITGPATSDIYSIDPNLASSLANNGGPTQTIALLSGSPAIDGGDNCILTNGCTPPLGFNLTTDQRGVVRSQGSQVDIGAYEILKYTITAASGGNGTVTPAGAAVYNFGDDPVYTITPNSGYSVADVLVDGVSVGAVVSYAFTDVAANHTISATFTANNYTITFNSAGGSAVADITLPFGSVVTAPANPTRAGYTFAGWNPAVPATMPLNGAALTAQWTANNFTVTFLGNGSTGGATAPQTTNVATALTSNGFVRSGYTFANWNTAANGAGTTYTNGQTYSFTADLTLYAQWTINVYTITATAGPNGSISPSGAVTVNSGGNQTFSITPASGYRIADVLVDGVTNPGAIASGSYTFINVVDHRTFSATFALIPPPITYVDDDWALVANGVDPDGAGLATEMGYDAFATIQGGIDGVEVGGEVVVYPGSYSGNIDVNRVMDVHGNFTITGSLTVSAPGATVSPGYSPGIINTGNFTMSPMTTLNVEIASGGGVAGTDYDQVNVTGTVNLGGANLNVTLGYTPTFGDSYVIVNNDGVDAVTGTFAGLPEGATVTVGLNSFTISYVGGVGSNDVVLTASAFCTTVSTPTLTSQTTHPALTGVPVTIPVTTSNLTGSGVVAADFTFTYNSAVMVPDTTPATVAGTINPGAVLTVSTATPGSMVVSLFDSTPFAGGGTLVFIKMRVIGQVGSSTPLTLTNFRYNGGTVGVCNPVTNGTLTVIGAASGRVWYSNTNIAPNGMGSFGVENVTMTQTGPIPGLTTTNGTGNYTIAGIGNGTHTITPTRAPQGFNAMSFLPSGIKSNDASRIAQHVVGLVTLTGRQLDAAKVSGLPAVSSFDAALIAQWIVGSGPSFPGNQTGKWKFFPVSRTYTNVTASQINEDYDAVLMGDVNGDWVASATRPASTQASKDAVRASVSDIVAAPGTTVTVPFRIDNLRGRAVTSYQFDVEFDPAVLSASEVAADLAGTLGEGLGFAANSPEPGLLKVVAYGAVPVMGDGVYVNLRFSVIGGMGSTTPLTISNFRFNDGEDEVTSINGRLSVGSAADSTTLRGRTLSPTGRPVGQALVTVTSSTGESRSVISQANGSFEFGGLTLGETYTVFVQAKRYTFTAQTVSLAGSAVELDMIGMQQ